MKAGPANALFAVRDFPDKSFLFSVQAKAVRLKHAFQAFIDQVSDFGLCHGGIEADAIYETCSR